jgi:hypothetical protein
MNLKSDGGSINSVGYSPNTGSSCGRGINKKRFFKNNLHHSQNALIFGSPLKSQQVGGSNYDYLQTNPSV